MKRVIITGAGSGMGLATAKLLATHGFTVYAGIRRAESQKIIDAAEAEIGQSIPTVQLDVTEPDSVKRAIAQIVEQQGGLDILVNNAGFGLVSSVEDGTDEEFTRQFDVNVFGVLRCIREVVPVMRQQGHGQIINISSFLGKMGLPLLTHYAASKYAVEGITDSLRYELAPFGIAVNTVAPGLFNTGFVKHGLLANPNTTQAASPYAQIANILLPVIVEKINNGPSPDIVAEAVLQAIREPAIKRINTGAEAQHFESLSKQRDDETFEKEVAAELSLPLP